MFLTSVRFRHGLAVGLFLLGACSKGPEEAPAGEPPVGDPSFEDHEARRTSQELVSASEHYVGAGTMAAKQLALTFDDGPGPRTAELSTYLKNENIRAVFFVNGACIQSTTLPNQSCATPLAGATSVLAQLEADGHLVANHTTTHRDITGVPANQTVQELAETDAPIRTYGKTPYNRSLFRAPFGSWNGAVWNTLKTSAMNHYVGPIYWDIGGFSDRYPNAAADWACFQGSLKYQGGATKGYATTKECGDGYLTEINAVGRGIILMHDQYGWAQGHTVDMVKYLVPLLKNAGYTFVRADDVPIIASDFPSCAGTGCTSCSGPTAGTCTACAAGRYLANGSCVACSTCAAGTYQTAACTTKADTACAACDPSCATCGGPGTTGCTSCASGKYLSNGSCKDCTTCAAGTYATSACTTTSDTVCATCATCDEGFYTSTACGPTANTVCGTCHSSCKTCMGPDATQCGSCPSGQYAMAGTCKPCSTCGPGTCSKSACTASADTLCGACGTDAGAPPPERPATTEPENEPSPSAEDAGAPPGPEPRAAGGGCATTPHAPSPTWLAARALLALRRRRARG